MKMRTGFVSNSSSSSFVLVVKKEVFDKEIAEVEQNIIKDLILEAFSFRKLFGIEVAIHNDMVDRGGESLWGEEIDRAQRMLRGLMEPDEECDAYMEFHKFLKRIKLRSSEGNYLESAMDM